MSHVGNGENDFEDLPELWPPEMVAEVRSVRMRARLIIDRLEPKHLNTPAELAHILEQELALILREYNLNHDAKERLAAMLSTVKELGTAARKPTKRPSFWRRVLRLA